MTTETKTTAVGRSGAIAADRTEDKRDSIRRVDPALPVFYATPDGGLSVRAGTEFVIGGEVELFGLDTAVILPTVLNPGTDYAIVLQDDILQARVNSGNLDGVLGGFHYALGGNAKARTGGDAMPAINPCSIWDLGFRPGCGDPRGMAFVAGVRGSEHVPPFWADIYLLNAEHLARGTSAAGVEVADGSRRQTFGSDGKRVPKLDFATARAIMEGHGKGLLSLNEFFAAAYGVTEKTAAGNKPALTGLDPARTSAVGLMQASGNLYVWGHDADPDDPRAWLFGGSWVGGGYAGSRCASVGFWPGDSCGWIGARGRSDHLTT